MQPPAIVPDPGDEAARPAPKIPPLEILRTFLVLGVLGFGGPLAHLGLMERELVTRRRWISRDSFLDMLAAVNLVPGPNSTEMAIHIGLEVGGVRGMLASGFGFIFPAVVFSVALAMITVTAGQVPAVQGFFIGVKPVILVLILSAGYRLTRTAINNRAMLALLIAALLVILPGVKPIAALLAPLGVNGVALPELAILLVCGAVYVIIQYPQRLKAVVPLAVTSLPLRCSVGAAALSAAAFAAPLAQGLAVVGPTLFDLFARFFVIGGTLFGSGLVLASYMQRAFVDGLHWMTPAQLVDALVIGQSTPGPVLSTVAAAGYLMVNNYADPAPVSALFGIAAGAVSAIGVFMPAFLVILLLGRLVPLLRRSPAALDFLKGVNAGVIALLLGTFMELSYATLVSGGAVGGGVRIDWLTLALTGAFFFASERMRWTALRLVAVGAVIGFVRIAIGWV